MFGNSSKLNNNASNYTKKSHQPAAAATAALTQKPVHVSFFQRIISGGGGGGSRSGSNNNNNNGNNKSNNKQTVQCNNDDDAVDVIRSSGDQTSEFQSVQTLKQFWINAFGNSSKQLRKDRLTSESCEQIVVDRGKLITAKKTQSLNRNFVVSSEVSFRPSGGVSSADNFYKYKTADLVRHSRNSGISESFLLASTPSMVTPIVAVCDKKVNTMIIAADVELRHPHAASSCQDNDGGCDDADKPRADNENADKTNAKSLANSVASSTASLRTTTTNESLTPSRKSAVTSRKCSFRTAGYHVKKMSTSTSVTSTTSTTVGGNKVAALTLRFNQLIQNDADIRDEVARKKEMILHRSGGGHVFKIKANDTASTKSKKSRVNRSDSSSDLMMAHKSGKKKPSVRRKNSSKQPSEATISPSTPVSVKDKIQIFEPVISEVGKRSVAKPQVPDKSAQVLRRTQEIVAQNSLKKSKLTEKNVVQPVEVHPPKRLTLENIKEDTEIISSDAGNPKPKNKVSRIYEKLTFKSSSFLSRKKVVVIETPIVPVSPTSIRSASPTMDDDELPDPVDKIMDALAAVSQRIEHLSKSESCLVHAEECADAAITPNPSFLFRSTSRPAAEHYYQITEAINVNVIKKTQSMDETHFREASSGDYGNIFKKTDELLHRIKIIESSEKEEIDDEPAAAAKATTFNDTSPSIETSSNIYQSIAEVKSLPSSVDIAADDTVSINSYESYENYEAVDDDELIQNVRNENGYEICSPPPPEPPPPRLNGSIALAPPSSSSSSEQPALPVPKRLFNQFDLQKSNSTSSNYEMIKYDKIPPRPPKSVTHPVGPLERNSSTETEYEGENIYDVIKPAGQMNTEKQHQHHQQDYESIYVPSPILRLERPAKRSTTDSDTGSTLSSDIKTNSLYGTSSISRNMAAEEMRTEMGTGTDCGSSTADNSDEWIDISDTEADGEKQKFVM